MSTSLLGSRVMHVKRGNLEVLFVVNGEIYARHQVYELAETVLIEMLQEQLKNPGRSDAPIRTDGTQYAIRVNGRDEALNPSLTLSEQTEGCWEFRTLPVEGQTDATARLPVCQFELVEVLVPSVVYAG